MSLKKFIFTIILSLPAAAMAAGFSIIAIVNNDVITKHELEDRVKLIIRSTHLQDSSEVRENINPKVLQIMIDDKLKLQEAKRLNIDVSEEDMANAVKDLEQQNNLKPGEFNSFLKKNGFPEESLMSQLKAQIAWKKIIGQKIRPRIRLSEYELDELYNISQNKKNIAPTETEEKKPDMNNTQVNLRQLFASNTGTDAKKILEDNAKKIKSCKDLEQFENNAVPGIELRNFGMMKIINLAEPLRPLAAGLKVGKASSVATSSEGFSIFLVCERKMAFIKQEKKAPSEPPTKEKVAEILGAQKIDLEARRYLKKLRDEAFIEIRM